MKTKFKIELRGILSVISLFMLLTGFASIATNRSINDPEIPLAGSLTTPQQRSLSADFVVTVDANSINIAYWKDYTNITIEIIDTAGQSVYNRVVNPVAGESLVIDISDWATGSYHISFTNAAGACIYGDFNVLH